jgi:hypothetical protein
MKEFAVALHQATHKPIFWFQNMDDCTDWKS